MVRAYQLHGKRAQPRTVRIYGLFISAEVLVSFVGTAACAKVKTANATTNARNLEIAGTSLDLTFNSNRGHRRKWQAYHLNA
jgi:hypothetical protein